MIRKLLLSVSFFSFFLAESQNQDDYNTVEDNSISTQLYTKCFQNLNQGNEIFKKYSTLDSSMFCSLLHCSFLLSYKETAIQMAAEQRLIGITTQLFKEGNPVYLISGLESSSIVKKKNENLEDDNHIVYISYAECTSPPFLSKAADIVNKETLSLIKKECRK